LSQVSRSLREGRGRSIGRFNDRSSSRAESKRARGDSNRAGHWLQSLGKSRAVLGRLHFILIRSRLSRADSKATRDRRVTHKRRGDRRLHGGLDREFQARRR
jgi:hypothetical protein